MRCPTCKGPFISHGGRTETCVGYYSPPGHDHDDNCVSITFTCKQGHSTAVFLRRSCFACDWKGKAECWCHRGKTKVDEWPGIFVELP